MRWPLRSHQPGSAVSGSVAQSRNPSWHLSLLICALWKRWGPGWAAPEPADLVGGVLPASGAWKGWPLGTGGMGGCGAEPGAVYPSDRDGLCHKQPPSVPASPLSKGTWPCCRLCLCAEHSPAGWGSAPRGHVCYVSRKPLQKNILETQRFPFCRHTNEPQTQPTSKRPLMSRALPRPAPVPGGP